MLLQTRARKILSGIGFEEHVVPMDRKTKHMSGGWRMRVSLAKALFSSPTILLLDEPTNHLDLEACVWLEEYLKTYPKCLLCVSHSQDFMNTVCNRMLWLNNMKLKEYHGNYDMFVKLVDAEEKVQSRAWEKQCMDVEKLQDYIRKNSANKKTYKSAQSKQKVLDKLMLTAVEKPMIRKTTFTFEFLECHRLPSPVLPFDNVSFCYNGDLATGQVLYRDLDLGVDCDSRIALVGPNGSGKSTLLKLMAGELQPTNGTVSRAQGLVLGKYHQHSEDVFDMTKTPLEFFPDTYPNEKLTSMGVPSMSLETWRAYLGTFGITGRLQETQIGQLSDGQKSRLIFAMVRMGRPNVLLLDEPTNHLDVGAIDGLARVINNFNGGVVLVSHDFRLIDQVAKIIWECTGPNDGATIRVFPGTIHEYKAKLAKKMGMFL
jgi:ATP-binding cassette subfamily F protein 2